jgi:predicted nucleic-acid-binding protein
VKFFLDPDGTLVLLPKLPVIALRGVPAPGKPRRDGQGYRRRSRWAVEAPMTGLDTNILVRYFAQDDPIQSPAATRIMEKGLSAANRGYISGVAMVETVWVLDRAYGFGHGEIADVIERILQTDTLVVENDQEVFAAMTALGDGHGAFADALIGLSWPRPAVRGPSRSTAKPRGCPDSCWRDVLTSCATELPATQRKAGWNFEGPDGGAATVGRILHIRDERCPGHGNRAAVADHDRHVLFSIGGVADGRGIGDVVETDVPEEVAAGIVAGSEPAVH